MKTIKGIASADVKPVAKEKAKPQLEISLQIVEGVNRFGKKYHALDAQLVDENGVSKWNAAKIFKDHIPAWLDAISDKNVGTFRKFLKDLDAIPTTPKK